MKKYLFISFFFLFLSFVSNSELYTSENSNKNLLEAFKILSQINSHETKNIHYAIDLLTNLTKQLADSSNKTCKEYFFCN